MTGGNVAHAFYCYGRRSLSGERGRQFGFGNVSFGAGRLPDEAVPRHPSSVTATTDCSRSSPEEPARTGSSLHARPGWAAPRTMLRKTAACSSEPRPGPDAAREGVVTTY